VKEVSADSVKAMLKFERKLNAYGSEGAARSSKPTSGSAYLAVNLQQPVFSAHGGRRKRIDHEAVNVVSADGLEPSTHALKGHCSAN
jgi:hypothetical protein